MFVCLWGDLKGYLRDHRVFVGGPEGLPKGQPCVCVFVGGPEGLPKGPPCVCVFVGGPEGLPKGPPC